MRRGRKILAWVIGIFVLLIVAIILFIAFFDWNRLKPTINEKVSEAIGRPFAINGDLSTKQPLLPSRSDRMAGADPILLKNSTLKWRW